jgi:hypothetical protein
METALMGLARRQGCQVRASGTILENRRTETNAQIRRPP